MKTPITYYGGKQNLIDEILPMIPKHRIYCEPFFGGGAVFFAKSKSFLEVINDKNDFLINFYQQCIDNFDELQHKVQHTLHSESEFNKAKRIYNNPTSHTEIEKAWAFWVVTNVSIMATPRGGWKRDNGTGGSHIGVSLENHRKNFQESIHNRLSTVQISCRDALDVIKERDTPDTFFYLDSPYMNADQQHYRGYTEKDFKQLLEVLTNIKGKFLLSNFASDILQEYVDKQGWNMKSIICKSMIPTLINKPKKKIEILVFNYRDIQQRFLF